MTSTPTTLPEFSAASHSYMPQFVWCAAAMVIIQL
jgi:hypothetical protein